MAYGATVLKGDIASQASEVSAGTLSNNSNVTATSGAGTALTGQVHTVAAEVSGGTLSVNANVAVT